MSMEVHTLRAVKITQNIFELRKVNREIEEVSKIMEVLERRKTMLENSLSMRIGRNSSNSNYLKITLNSMDTYDMKFCKLTRKFEEKSVKEYKNIHDEQLRLMFTKHTGMYTKLF